MSVNDEAVGPVSDCQSDCVDHLTCWWKNQGQWDARMSANYGDLECLCNKPYEYVTQTPLWRGEGLADSHIDVREELLAADRAGEELSAEIHDMQGRLDEVNAAFDEVFRVSEEFRTERDDAQDVSDSYIALWEIAVEEATAARKERDEALDLAWRFYNEKQNPLDGGGEVFIHGKKLWQNMATGEWTTDPDNLTDSVPPHRAKRERRPHE